MTQVLEREVLENLKEWRILAAPVANPGRGPVWIGPDENDLTLPRTSKTRTPAVDPGPTGWMSVPQCRLIGSLTMVAIFARAARPFRQFIELSPGFRGLQNPTVYLMSQ